MAMGRGPADRGGHRRRIDAVLREAKIVAPIHGMLQLRHVEPGEAAAVGTPLSGRPDHDAPILLIAMSRVEPDPRSAPIGSFEKPFLDIHESPCKN
jgi:hypothetical protein